MDDSILTRWHITAQELTQVIDQNPSLRGMLIGYLAELKLEKLWLSDASIEDCTNTMTMIAPRRATGQSATKDMS